MEIHNEHPDMGYRRIRDTLEHDHDIKVNDKRVLRVCRKKKVQSYIKHRYNCCTKPASDPAYIAENILDLCGKRPIAFEYSDHNDNPLVFGTFDKALEVNSGATPLFHSDRGNQYTSKTFRQKILDAGMTLSMSRVAKCIDNRPMEGFRGIMKREMYYRKKYKTKEELIKAIEDYIDYYKRRRVQRNLCVLTPQEFYEKQLQTVV
ncbi:IS3 family transposase [[Clostridium] hylemonae]|nr:DDE-type integrase/transposase/recombinase [[Clostridium] hylemonae]MCB7520604.1 IS3 family transposase [[Clostridium] hylemonae]